LISIPLGYLGKAGFIRYRNYASVNLHNSNINKEACLYEKQEDTCYNSLSSTRKYMEMKKRKHTTYEI
jgi:hypothetical protein